jgi:hypothetical protein
MVKAAQVGDEALVARWGDKLERLERELNEAGRESWKGFVKDWKRTGKEILATGRDFALGKTKGNRALWDFYVWSSMDVPSKYATLKYLVEVEGLPMSQALSRISNFFQHLHRVDTTTKRWMSKVEGSMFAGFAVDHMRIITNVAKHSPEMFFSDMAQVYAFNHAIMAANGKDIGDYQAWWAKSRNMKQSWMTDMMAMARGLMLPIQDKKAGTGVEMLPISHAWIDVFDNQNPAIRDLVDTVTQDVENPYLKLGAHAGVGTLMRFAGGGIAGQIYGMMYRGRDQQGNPFNGIGDVLDTGFKTFVAPPQFPGGKDWPRIWRSLPFSEEREVSPSTLEEKSFGEVMSSILFNIKPEATSVDVLRQSLTAWLEDNNQDVKFFGNESFDDLRTTLTARGDPSKRKEIIDAWAAEHAPKYILPGGKTAPSATSPSAAKRMIANMDTGTLRVRINSGLRVDHQINVWALWRSAARDFDPEIDAWMKQDIAKKLEGGRAFAEQFQRLTDYSTELASEPSVPAAVKQQVRLWRGAMGLKLLEKVE